MASLKSLYVITVLVLPLLWLLLCLAIWCLPMRPRRLVGLLRAAEVIYALAFCAF